MEEYIEECRELSLTARAAVGLLVFERFCLLNELGSKDISDFLNYMWQWPLIDGADEFEPWEQSRPKLVDYGLGDDADTEIEEMLVSSDIPEEKFRNLVCGIVDTLWGSFWGAAENESSLKCLQGAIRAANLKVLPPLTPFRFSKFSEGSGWGNKIRPQDCEFWRGCIQNT